RGIIQGLQGDNEAKLATLASVIKKYPKSNYADDAAFEVPYTYFLMGREDEAIEGLAKMVEEYPRSSYVPRALITIGLVQYNQDELDDRSEERRVGKECRARWAAAERKRKASDREGESGYNQRR